MGWSDAQAEGFALAAILADERDLTWARTYVDASLVEAAKASMDDVRGSRDKRHALAQLVARVTGATTANTTEPYATWLEEITKARARTKDAEREPSDELVSWLSRLARLEPTEP